MRYRRQAGVTLVELMIASSITLFALSALLTVYSATARHSSRQLQQAHLHQQLHATLQLLTRDLRRSGYWHFDPRLHSPVENPFTRPDNRLRIGAYPGEPAGSCILLAYDLDQDGRVGKGHEDTVEQFGYRLRNGLLQSRYGGRSFSCDSGYWQAVTDPSIEISQLTFTQHSNCTNLNDPEQNCAPDDAQLIQLAIETRLSGKSRAAFSEVLELSTWTWVRNAQMRDAER